MKDTLQISFLGQSSVLFNNEIVKLQSKQAKLLLAYLIESPTSHSRTSLTALFWPDRKETEALGLLRTLLNRLQKKVPALLVVDRYSIGVDSSLLGNAIWVDTIQFKRLANANDTESWQEALEHYRGAFLNGFDSGFSEDILNWLDQKREDYAIEYRQVLKKLVDVYFTNAKPDLGLGYARTWLELDNYNEEAHRYILQFHGLNGDFIAAKNHFSKLTELLHTDLGVAPELLTIECFNHLSLTIDKQNVTDSKSIPVNTSYQNLPYRADDFVGRSKDIKAIKTIFEQHSLITLYAWGGLGKTRLAIAFAEHYQHQFKDGVLYVSLTNQRYASVLDYFREALHLESSIASDIIQDLKHFFSKRHLLLIIDNAEEYIEDLIVLKQFLEASPQLKILVTSRVALGLQAEYKYELQGLSLPDSKANLKLCESYVLLGNRLARSGVANNLDEAMLFQLFKLSEGIPLVLEMMAAWLTVLPADRLNNIEDLYLLEHPLQDIDDRHKTIALCFEYSWSLLSFESQNLAAAASIFRTEFSFSELQAVTGASTKDVFTVTHSSFLSHNADGSFKQHPMVKYFCRQKLQANVGHFQQTQENYINYYTHRAKILNEGYAQEQKLILHKVNIDNLWDVACLLVKQGHANRLINLVSILGLYNLFKNDFVRGRDQLEYLLKLIEEENYDLEDVHLKLVCSLTYVSLVHFCTSMGDIKEAQNILDKHAEECHNTVAILKTFDPAAALFNGGLLNYFIAHVQTVKGDVQQSMEVLDKVLKVEDTESAGIASLLISVRILQSYNQLYLGKYHDAIAGLQENIDKHDNFDLRVLSYSNLAKAYLALRQIDMAEHYISLALADAESTGFQLLIYDIHFTKALIMISEKRFEEASVLIEQTNSDFFAHPSKRNRYDFRYTFRYFFTLASLYDRQYNNRALKSLAEHALFEAKRNQDILVVLTSLYYLGRAEVTTEPEAAKQRFEYVYRHPQTPHHIRQLAELELNKSSSSTDTTIDIFSTLSEVNEPRTFSDEIA